MTNKRTFASPTILLIAVSCIGAASVFAQSEERNISDQDVTFAVETELLVDEAVPAHLIDVTTANGVVTLSGSVSNILAGDRAVRIARTIRGARAVVNRIAVTPVDVPDAQLQTNVQKALRSDPATEGYQIEAKIDDGAVTLTGTVDSWQEKKLAGRVARGVRGVHALTNEIEVEYEVQRSDEQIRSEIQRRLEWDPWIDEGLLEVHVHDGQVRLTGTVGTAAERTRARTDAWVTGVKSVDTDSLTVEWWARDKMRRKHKYAAKSDEEIKKAVEDAFMYDPRVASFEPTVTVDNGVVTLSGTVDNLAAKRAAVEDAQNTLGVWRVKDHLKVRPPVPLDRTTLVGYVKGAIARDPYLDRFDLTVSVYNARAYLYGTVDTHFEKRHAARIAERVPGIVEVENRLDVRDRWESKADEAIKNDIESQFAWSPLVDGEAISVTVQDGVVTLVGMVDSWVERGAATENAFEGGAKAVRNMLAVRGDRERKRSVYHEEWYAQD